MMHRLRWHAWRKRALALPPDACCRAALDRLGDSTQAQPVFMLCVVAADAVKRGREAAEEESGALRVALDTARSLAAALIHADANRASWRDGGGAAMKALRHVLLLAATRNFEVEKAWCDDVARVVRMHVVASWRRLFCDETYTCVQRAQLLKTVDACLTTQMSFPQLFGGEDLVLELVADRAAERNLAFLLCQVESPVATSSAAAGGKEKSATTTLMTSDRAALEAFLTGNNPRRLFRIAIRVVLHATCLVLPLRTRYSTTGNSAKRQKFEAPYSPVHAGLSAFPCVDSLLVDPDSVRFCVATMMDADGDLLTFLRDSLQIWSSLFKDREKPEPTAVKVSIAHWHPTAVLGTLCQALGGHAVTCTDVIVDMFLHPETGVDAIRYCLDLAKFVLRERQTAAGARVGEYEDGSGSLSSLISSERAEEQEGMGVLAHLGQRISQSPSLMSMGLAPLVRALRQIEGV